MTHANGLSPSASRGGFPRQGPPPAAFRGRARLGNGSNRSSLASYDGMNSEELWTLEDDPTPDMSNPTRSAAERPLDTVRRMSYTISDQSLYAGMPTEIIWPTAPAEEEYLYEPPPKTRSLTNVASIKRRTTLRKSKSKGAAMDSHPPISGGGYPKRAASKDALSSAHSSTTSLSIPHNKSQASLKSSRPPSMAGVGAYHYDLLGALAPRDGGYAIAAQIGHSFSPVSSVNSLDDRRSIHASPPGSFRGARVPSSRSSGMRWSVDGEDPILPPGPVRGSGGSMLSVSSTQSDDYDSPQSAQLAVAQATRPCEPSPLSMQTTTAADMDAVSSPVAVEAPQMFASVPAPAPINMFADVPVEEAEPAAADLKKSKTKKEMKAEKKEAEKQAKLAAKAEAQRAAQQKADAAKKAADDKRRAQEEAVRAKAQAKADAARKQQEDKERAKLQKKEAEQKKFEQAKAAEQRKIAEQKRAAEWKKEQKLKKAAAPEPKVVAAPVKTEQAPKRRTSLKFKRSSSGAGPASTAAVPVATPATRGSPPPAPSQASRLTPPVAAAAGGAAAVAASQLSSPSNSELYTGPRPPSDRTPSLSSTQASSTPRPEKRGFMSSLKKRFSMANMEPTPTLQKPRPNSIAVSQGSPTPSAPIAQAAPLRADAPAPAPAPAPATQRAPIVQPPPRSTSSPQKAPVQQQRPSMPPPVIIPPRGSSANAAMPVAIPMRGSSLAIVGGSESSDDNVESGASNPSSVIVTPTISMDRNSTSSLLEHPRPNGAFRERSDSGISAGGSQTTDGGLHTPPSEASFPAPLQNRKESDSMHMQPPPALTVV